MKKTALVLALCALTLIIVLPIITSVNNSAGSSIRIDRNQQADGWPLPPPVPPTSTSARPNTLVADGWPLPPPFPPTSTSATANSLVADGWPLPPPFPPASTSATANTLVADGWPLPPPFPPSANTQANPYSV